MAKGYPDFFGVPIFPRYGGAQEEEGTVIVTIDDTTDLVTITGKGLVYHIELRATLFASAADDDFIITIDGVEYFTFRPSSMLRQGLLYPILGGIHLCNYSPSIPEFTAYFSGEVTFSDSILVQYVEASGNLSRAYWRIRYTRIV